MGGGDRAQSPAQEAKEGVRSANLSAGVNLVNPMTPSGLSMGRLWLQGKCGLTQ